MVLQGVAQEHVASPSPGLGPRERCESWNPETGPRLGVGCESSATLRPDSEVRAQRGGCKWTFAKMGPARGHVLVRLREMLLVQRAGPDARSEPEMLPQIQIP